MKRFTLFLASAVALLLMTPQAGLQAQAEGKGEVVIVQEIKHEDEIGRAHV